MTREQYEQHKRRLEEQLRAGIQLLESAYQSQVRALDLVWMLQEEESGAGAAMAFSSLPAPDAPARSQPQPHGQRTYEARDQIASSFYRLPETFTHNDVCQVLGYKPDRGVLFRLLRELVSAGHIRIVERGAGQRATVYAKSNAAEVPSSG